MHDVLRRYRQPHDTYVSAAEIGDETTVPLLLERFRLDAGTQGPPAPAAPAAPHDGDPATFLSSLFIRTPVQHAFSCVHWHLVRALAFTTNVDRGLYYPAWDAWWRENGHLPQAAWIANSFAAAGLHVAEPIDDRFALELIEVTGGGVEHLRFNALRLLGRASAGVRRAWIEAAATSGVAARRLGAVRVAARLEPNGYEDVLRRLARDSDEPVAREGLTALDVRLRHSRVATPVVRLEHPTQRDSLQWLVDTPGGPRWWRRRRLLALDIASGRLTSTPTPDVTADRGVWAGDRLVTGSYEGDLAAVDLGGRVRWRALAGNPERDRVLGLGVSDDLVVVARARRVEWWDPRAGTVRRVVDVTSDVYDLASAGDAVYVGTRDGLLRIAAEGTALLATDGAAIGVSVGPAGVCVTSRVVGCYDAQTLVPRWTRPIAPDGTWGPHVAPLQTGNRVIVLSGGRLAAHDAADGRTLWATTSGQHAHGAIVTAAGLFVRNERSCAELRDLTSGEVLAVWPTVPASSLGAVGLVGVIGGMDGSTWRVDLGAAASPRP